MPLVRISVPSHLTPMKVKALADAVHEGLVATCGIPTKDRFQMIVTFPEGSMLIDPTFPDVNRTADASIIEITFLEGHSDDEKKHLYRSIADKAVKAGFVADDIFISLLENRPVDWSPGRGSAFSGHK